MGFLRAVWDVVEKPRDFGLSRGKRAVILLVVAVIVLGIVAWVISSYEPD